METPAACDTLMLRPQRRQRGRPLGGGVGGSRRGLREGVQCRGGIGIGIGIGIGHDLSLSGCRSTLSRGAFELRRPRRQSGMHPLFRGLRADRARRGEGQLDPCPGGSGWQHRHRRLE